MGLITGLLTLPLAPVRGVVWIGEQLEAEAARELDEPTRLRRELGSLQAAFERGEMDEAEFERREDELLERLEAM
jgi:ADP-ribose pyrophosphatase YjhB (NUDIX family)